MSCVAQNTRAAFSDPQARFPGDSTVVLLAYLELRFAHKLFPVMQECVQGKPGVLVEAGVGVGHHVLFGFQYAEVLHVHASSLRSCLSKSAKRAAAQLLLPTGRVVARTL